MKVGAWTFSPEDGSLSRDGERRRLEHRAAKVLEALCRRAGATLSASELVETVWGGRALSQNSVAVVIADLRRALDDDSRNPSYIETIPKRGYRLLAPVEAVPGAAPDEPLPPPVTEAPSPTPRARGAWLLLLVLLIGGLGWAGWTYFRAPSGFTVAVGPFRNETGSAANDPLVPAYSELVTTELGDLPGVRLMRDETGVDARMQGTIVLWDGHPTLALSAEDPRTGAVLWTGMASAPPGRLPGAVVQEIEEFGAYVDSQGAGAR